MKHGAGSSGSSGSGNARWLAVCAAAIAAGFAIGYGSRGETPGLQASFTTPQQPAPATHAVAYARTPGLDHAAPAAPVEPLARAARNEDAPPVLKRPPNPWTDNLALASKGAKATGGNQPELLIDGNTSDYDASYGYAATNWQTNPPDAMVVTLKEAVTLNAVRVLLWDGDERYYRYRLEISPDAEGEARWTTVADYTQTSERRQSWQVLDFEPATVRRVRLTGTYNSDNGAFHVVEIEAYHIPGGLGNDGDDLQF